MVHVKHLAMFLLTGEKLKIFTKVLGPDSRNLRFKLSLVAFLKLYLDLLRSISAGGHSHADFKIT